MGIPDRYVAGGRWIEFKQIKWSGKRAVSPVRQLSGPQIRVLDRFTEAGDECWVAILFQDVEGVLRIMFLPWSMFRVHKPQWTPNQVLQRTKRWDGSETQCRIMIEESGFNASR